jgi:hypothetical protein
MSVRRFDFHERYNSLPSMATVSPIFDKGRVENRWTHFVPSIVSHRNVRSHDDIIDVP